MTLRWCFGWYYHLYRIHMQNNEHRESYKAPIAVVDATPFLTPEHFKSMVAGSEAVILAAFATGTIPERLIPIIKSTTESGVPVFLLSKNPGDSHGILNERKYEAQANAADAGAIVLKTVNVNNAASVLAVISEEISLGNHGKNLGMAIKKRFQ